MGDRRGGLMVGRATPKMHEQVEAILDNIEAGRTDMPRSATKTCPTCEGAKVAPGRYTEPAPLPCGTCDGTGVVPADEETAQAVEDAGTAPKPKAGTNGD